jgi:hypothetical protein
MSDGEGPPLSLRLDRDVRFLFGPRDRDPVRHSPGDHVERRSRSIGFATECLADTGSVAAAFFEQVSLQEDPDTS